MDDRNVVKGPWGSAPAPTDETAKEQWLRKSKLSKATETRRRNKARLRAADEMAKAFENARGVSFPPEIVAAVNAYWMASGVEP